MPVVGDAARLDTDLLSCAKPPVVADTGHMDTGHVEEDANHLPQLPHCHLLDRLLPLGVALTDVPVMSKNM